MADSNMAQPHGGKLPPSRAPGDGTPQRKRSAFLTCFFAALLLMLLAFAGAIVYQATDVRLFQDAVNRYVVATGIVSQSDGEAFANDTLGYLTGKQSVWEPSVTIGDHRVAIPETFKQHMANVKRWVGSAKTILLAGAAVALLLLLWALVGRRGGRQNRFSFGGYYVGAMVPLVLAAGFGLWAYLNFDSLWLWIHQTFIPDGIFSADEEIMRLFPLQVFANYLQPVGITCAMLAGAVLLFPLLLWPLTRLLNARFGPNGSGKGHGTAAANENMATSKTAHPENDDRKHGGLRHS